MQTLFRTREAMRGFGKKCLKIAKNPSNILHIAGHYGMINMLNV